MRAQKWISIFSLSIVYFILMVACIFVIINVEWGYQALVTAIEAIILFIILLTLHILERCYDPEPCEDQEYIQIGMRKYGEDITMAGVPLSYNDQIKDNEERKDVELRKQALTSIIASVQNFSKNGFFAEENLKGCRLKKDMRRAFSYRHLPAIQEEDQEGESDDEYDFSYKPRRKRRFSIGTDKNLEQYADKKFFTAICDIKSGKYLPDNVYAESHPLREISPSSRDLNVDRATQTDDSDLKLLWKLSRTIPPFKLADILGEFEMDENGMFIIIRDAGQLKDRHGRLVNTRGYLVDQDGNVVHQNGTKIFNKNELDENNEIPAPFLLDEDEFDILTKPQLIPKHRVSKQNRSKKNTKPPISKKFKKKDTDRKIKPSSKGSKRSIDHFGHDDRMGSIMTDHPNEEGSRFEKFAKSSKIRPITSETKRPATTKKSVRRTRPMPENFTEGKTIKVEEETSDFSSNFGLGKIPITAKRQNYLLNETNDIDDADEIDLKETKEKLPDGFFKDYLLNQRPEYYGDTSDIISKSRKLYY